VGGEGRGVDLCVCSEAVQSHDLNLGIDIRDRRDEWLLFSISAEMFVSAKRSNTVAKDLASADPFVLLYGRLASA
jgi:hypothetical protein